MNNEKTIDALRTVLEFVSNNMYQVGIIHRKELEDAAMTLQNYLNNFS